MNNHINSKLHNNKCHKPTSFTEEHKEAIFKTLNLQKGETFLDLGCGVGDYSLYAATISTKLKQIFAIDINKDLLLDLEKTAKLLKIDNLTTKYSDINKDINIETNSIDKCLIATVLHATNIFDTHSKFFSELTRIMKDKGEIVILECKKERTFFGPPFEKRIDPKTLEQHLQQYGFDKLEQINLNNFYLMKFRV
ncbi:MAG: methyltransferase domain-containing protein [Spirochaetales bacterium]|nr:methyltransferase domain-containing protein [Spirochaetales bacterium]